jgi:3-phenylpropionate/trans-cinnamate dioxygenase ferredoxin subunit
MNWKPLSVEDAEKIKQLQNQQLIKITFESKLICVTKLEDGVFGMHNICPHAGAQLHHGFCNRKGIVGCPLHGYKFDIKTGRSTDGNNYKMKNYLFKIEEDKVYIAL